YYGQVRTETQTAGVFAHNDPLQFMIEMGWPAGFEFLLLVLIAAASTNRRNLVSGCVLLALFIQSMVEFQFYVPALSLFGGAALGYHLLGFDGKTKLPLEIES